MRVTDDSRGSLDVRPTAFERVAEAAAAGAAAVSAARSRYGVGELDVRIRIDRARDVPDTLRAVQRRVRESLADHGLPVAAGHGLPVAAVNVVVTGYDRQTRRELS